MRAHFALRLTGEKRNMFAVLGAKLIRGLNLYPRFYSPHRRERWLNLPGFPKKAMRAYLRN